MIKAFKQVTEILEREPAFAFAREMAGEFEAAGIYLVGGAVRDLILGRDSKDYDFVVTGVPAASLERFLSERGEVNLVGRDFGVFKFRPKGAAPSEDIDIALPRRDFAAGTGGYRDVEAQSDPALPIEEDLARRDFTMNALAWDVRAARLIDPRGGLDDINEKKVRAVGDPRERFREDCSRMLRGLRLAVQLGFEIESGTWKALVTGMPRINDLRDGERVVPFETVARELLKSLAADPVRTLDLWDEAGAVRELLPELLALKGCTQPPEFHSEGDVWAHTRLVLSHLADEKPPAEVTVAALLHDIGKPATRQVVLDGGAEKIVFHGHAAAGAALAKKIIRRLKLSSVKGCDVSAERVRWLVEEHMFPNTVNPREARPSTLAKRFFHPKYRGRDLLTLARADAAAAVRPKGQDFSNLDETVRVIEEMRVNLKAAHERIRPLLDGHDVMRLLGIEPGPKVQEVLDLLIDAQARGIVSTREEAEKYVRHPLR